MSVVFHNLNDKFIYDERGWVANPFRLPNFPQRFGHLHAVSLEAGAVRGNHLHRTCREWLFIFGGRYSIFWREGDEVKRRIMEKEEYFTIEIPPGIVHAVRNEGESVIYLLSYQDADLDTVKADTEYYAIL